MIALVGADRWLAALDWVVDRLVDRLPSNLRVWLFGLATASLALLVVLWQLDGVLAQLHLPRDPSRGMSALHESGVEQGWDDYVERVNLAIDPGELGNAYLALDVALVLAYTSLLALGAAALARAIGTGGGRPRAHRTTLAGALLLAPVLALADLVEDVLQFWALDDDKGVRAIAVVAGFKWALLAAVMVPCLLGVVYLALGQGTAARGYTRTLAVLRFQLVAVAGLAVLLLGPLAGEQSLDAILRWELDPWDGVAAIALTALLGGAIIGTALVSVQAEEREERIQISPRALSGIGVVVFAIGCGFWIADEGGWGLLVLGGLLVALAPLSAVLAIRTQRQSAEQRSGTLLLPHLLGLAPLFLLGLAVLRAMTGQLALFGFGGPVAWWAWAIVAIVVEIVVVLAFAGLPTWTGRGGGALVLVAGVVAFAVTVAIYVNPWSAGALVGAVGAAVTFLMVLVFFGWGVTLLERRYEPPAALVLASFHRLPVILLLLVAALGGALLDKDGDHPVRPLDATIELAEPPVLAEVFDRWKKKRRLRRARTGGRPARLRRGLGRWHSCRLLDRSGAPLRTRGGGGSIAQRRARTTTRRRNRCSPPVARRGAASVWSPTSRT